MTRFESIGGFTGSAALACAVLFGLPHNGITALLFVACVFLAGSFFPAFVMAFARLLYSLAWRNQFDRLQQPAQTPKGQMVNPQQFGSFPWEQ